MAVPTEFYPEIFLFEIQKKHGKHLKIQKIFRICVSNTIYDLIMAELKIFLQYEASIVPCSYIIVSGKDFSVSEIKSTLAIVELGFPQLIKETKSYYTYSGLSLIAEIGGYVGLFLGISVNQLINLWDILDILHARIQSFFKI